MDLVDESRVAVRSGPTSLAEVILNMFYLKQLAGATASCRFSAELQLNSSMLHGPCEGSVIFGNKY